MKLIFLRNLINVQGYGICCKINLNYESILITAGIFFNVSEISFFYKKIFIRKIFCTLEFINSFIMNPQR